MAPRPGNAIWRRGRGRPPASSAAKSALSSSLAGGMGPSHCSSGTRPRDDTRLARPYHLVEAGAHKLVARSLGMHKLVEHPTQLLVSGRRRQFHHGSVGHADRQTIQWHEVVRAKVVDLVYDRAAHAGM